jgi:hypothetical protein
MTEMVDGLGGEKDSKRKGEGEETTTMLCLVMLCVVMLFRKHCHHL